MNDENEDNDDAISKYLGMPSINAVIENHNQLVEYDETQHTNEPLDPRKDADFDDSRDMIKSVLSVGEKALQEMAKIADQSQNPAAYEKLATVMSSLTTASKTLMDIHKTKKLLDKVDLDNPALKDAESLVADGSGPNIIFAGSTAQLQQYMADLKKAEK